MGDTNVLNYINDQKGTNTECAAEWIVIESLFNDKLWQQLTEKIIELIGHPAFRNEDCRIVQFYRNFMSTFERELDPHKLVAIVSVLTNSMGDKTKAMEIIDSIEGTVKRSDQATWHCYILKGQIQLNHLNDLVATKTIVDALNLAIRNAATVPVHWSSFLLATNYFHRLVDECNDNYRRLEEKFRNENEKLHNQNEELNGEIGRLKNEIATQRETFEKKLLSVQTEIEAKFTTEAVRNFEEVIQSQTEVSTLRKLNGRLLSECCQMRNERTGLEDDKSKLEAKLETIITEQEQQKKALMLMGAHLERLSLKNDDDGKSSLTIKTG